MFNKMSGPSNSSDIGSGDAASTEVDAGVSQGTGLMEGVEEKSNALQQVLQMLIDTPGGVEAMAEVLNEPDCPVIIKDRHFMEKSQNDTLLETLNLQDIMQDSIDNILDNLSCGPYTIQWCTAADGHQYAREFMIELLQGNTSYKKLAAKLLYVLVEASKQGPRLRAPLSKPLGQGLHELRAKQGSNIARLIFFFDKGKLLLVTNGFIKDTQKTPLKELERALKIKQFYLRSKENV